MAMKIKLFLLIVFILALSSKGNPQRIVTLKECYDLAAKKTTLAAEKEIYNSMWQLKDKNLTRNWLPSIDANANFIYNSDIVDFTQAFASVPIPGLANSVPLMPRDNYKLTLDINQVIYDGGMVRKARSVEEADLKINQQQTESDIYKLRGQVNNCYFSLLLIERQRELLTGFLDVLKKRMASMQSAVDNGVALKSDIDVMTSEKIKIEQQLTEIDLKKAALNDVLSDLTGIEIGTNTSVILPQVTGEFTDEISRPELKVFDLRKDQLDAGMELLQTRRMPRAFGFATLGYGSPPGQNFFEDNFSTYYIVGAGIKWNIYDWDKVKNEKQQIRLQQGMLEGRKAELTDNLKRTLQTKEAEIASLNEALKRDNELIAIRKRITASAESQYGNGTITATELLNEMNSEKQAEINYEIHKISLEMAKVEYYNISGREIE
jgi:outer membrane protein TolC